MSNASFIYLSDALISNTDTINLKSILLLFDSPTGAKKVNIVMLLAGGWYVYQQRNDVHNNCGIEIYYQTDMQTTHENMLLELFCQIISEPCFNTLRTKEQLGETPSVH